jgi:hypothetical protein
VEFNQFLAKKKEQCLPTLSLCEDVAHQRQGEDHGPEHDADEVDGRDADNRMLALDELKKTKDHFPEEV